MRGGFFCTLSHNAFVLLCVQLKLILDGLLPHHEAPLVIIFYPTRNHAIRVVISVPWPLWDFCKTFDLPDPLVSNLPCLPKCHVGCNKHMTAGLSCPVNGLACQTHVGLEFHVTGVQPAFCARCFARGFLVVPIAPDHLRSPSHQLTGLV